jgi:hypothetical protein
MNEINPRIIQFYDGDLTPNEERAFMLELEANAELKSEWLFYGKIIEGIKAHGASELKEYIRSNVELESSEKQSNLWMYAAASVTFLLFSYFAIYSYLETGNIKEATRIITLKDEKSKKLKFWKRSKNSSDVALNPSTSIYDDSLEILERDRSFDSYTESVTQNSDAPEDSDGLPGRVPESASTGMNIEPSAETRMSQTGEKPSLLLNQLQLVSIRLADNTSLENTKSSALAKSIEPAAAKTKTDKKMESVSRMDKDTQDIRTGKRDNLNTPQRFKLRYYEKEISKPFVRVYKSGTTTELDLYNFWGENPLIYEISGQFYLDLGKTHIWKIPNSDGQYDKIEWVRDKNIIEKIRN